MERLIQNSLILLGLSDKEVKFFLTCFTKGPSTINEIAHASRLERSTAYLISEELLRKGFLEEDFKLYKKRLRTIDPKTLLRMVAARQRLIGRQEIELTEKLPELETLYLAQEFKPKVRVFEGTRGLLSIFNDILAIKQELLLWTNQETERLFFTKSFHDKFIQERIKKEIPIKVLATNNKMAKDLQLDDKNSLRQTKILPKGINFTAETYIYGDKIAIIDFKKDIFGIIIENVQIASSQRAIFEMSWERLA